MKNILLASIILSSVFMPLSATMAECNKEIETLLDKVNFAKQFKRKSNHFAAYKQAEDTMRACRYRISDSDMMSVIQIKKQQKALSGN